MTTRFAHQPLLTILPLAVSVAIGAGFAQAPRSPAAEEQQVVAAVEKLFAAMRARDADALRALLHDDARLISVRPTGEVSVRSKEDWIRTIAESAAVLDERMRDPEVRIDGNLATLWARYTFRRGGQLSHCGTNAFDYVRIGGEWRLMTVAFTTQTTGCTEPAN